MTNLRFPAHITKGRNVRTNAKRTDARTDKTYSDISLLRSQRSLISMLIHKEKSKKKPSAKRLKILRSKRSRIAWAIRKIKLQS